jgi:hypothetical protein
LIAPFFKEADSLALDENFASSILSTIAVGSFGLHRESGNKFAIVDGTDLRKISLL